MMIFDGKARAIRSRGWRWPLVALALLAGGVHRGALAQDAEHESPPVERKSSQLFPPRMTYGRLIYLPKAHYSTENGAGVGGVLLYPFYGPGSSQLSPLSDLRLSFRYTLKGHRKAELAAGVFLGDGDWYTKAKLSFSDLRYRFWGLGPDSPSDAEEVYRPRDTLAYVELFRRVAGQFRLGVRYEFEHLAYIETEDGGLLDTVEYRGESGRAVFGAGLVAEWDTRDVPSAPTRGSYHQAFALVFDDELGSKHDFNNYNVDLRWYFSVPPTGVLATQFFVYDARGGVPIWRYAALGGRAHTRGYRLGRYLDRSLLSFQGEYRFRLPWKFEGVAFGGLGDVAPHLDELKFENMRLTLGGGLRFRVPKHEDIRVRLDAAAGGASSLRLYFSLGEAF